MYSETIKTLDLSAFIEKTLEVKMVDGTILHLKRPTKAMVLALQAVGESDEANRETLVRDFVLKVMNHNNESVAVVIDDMPDVMIIAIFNAYVGFISELVNNPNSQSPASQKGVTKQGRKSRQK